MVSNVSKETDAFETPGTMHQTTERHFPEELIFSNAALETQIL
jgi:hypothetical protein